VAVGWLIWREEFPTEADFSAMQPTNAQH